MEPNQPTNPSYEMPQPQQTPGTALSGKRVLIILGVLIVLLVIVLGVTGKSQAPAIAEPTTAPTTEVSPTTLPGVYTNPQKGISFTHPVQVTAKDVSPDIVTVSSLDGPVDPDAPVTGMHISILTGNKIANQLDQIRTLFITPSIKDIEVDGVAGKEISGYGKGELQGKFIKFVEVYDGTKTYELSYFEGEPNFPKEDFDQIVASFKLTK